MATQTQYTQSKIHQHKFALWVGIASIMMMFAAFTSAYIVRKASGNWYEFKLPDLFLYNSAVIVLSSFTLHTSFKAFKNGREGLYKGMLAATFILGLLFVILQYRAWVEMNAIGATFLVTSSSFVIVISGLHAAHVLGGIASLVVALAHAYILPFKPTLRRKQRFELVVNYWHFVDILWIYLVVFFLLQS